MLRRFTAQFFRKMRPKFQKFLFIEADLSYMEMRVKFNFTFFKKYIWKLFRV